MVKKLDDSDRDLLKFRPNIVFIEPDQEPGVIDPVAEEVPLQLEDVQEARARIKQLAKAVNTMAAAIQARADQRAKTMVIQLDLNVDQDAIQAMRRKFPSTPENPVDPTKITYGQYRIVKDDIRGHGTETAKKALVLPDDVQKARDEMQGGAGRFVPGQFGSEAANTGGLRPELDARAHIIEPLNIEEIQINLICILVNFIWKNFVLPAFKPIAIPFVGSLADALPQKLCNPGSDIEIPGLFILGNGVPDLLSGKVADKAGENL